MNKIAQIFETLKYGPARVRDRLPCAHGVKRSPHWLTIALSLLSMVSSASAMPMRMPAVKLTAHGLAVLEQQFAQIPALGIASALPEALCTQPMLTVRADPPVVAIGWVAAGCANNDYLALYLQQNGQVLAPKGLGRLLAENCPEAISDESIRATLVGEYENEMQRLGAWLHTGLEK